jgi:hypothetical protein
MVPYFMTPLAIVGELLSGDHRFVPASERIALLAF